MLGKEGRRGRRECSARGFNAVELLKRPFQGIDLEEEKKAEDSLVLLLVDRTGVVDSQETSVDV